MPLWKTEAITLHSRRWGEADRIVTLYTLKLGKVRGVARGARRMNSQFGAGLEPFGHVEVTFFEKGQDALVRISQVDVRESFLRLRESLAQMSAAARLVNIVSALSADRDAGTRIFSTLLNGLQSLQDKCDPVLTSMIVQIQILGHTGFRPQTDHCASCNNPYALQAARFCAVSGGLLCRHCEGQSHGQSLPMSPGSVAFIQQARRLPFPAATRLKAVGQIRREVEAAIEAYIMEVIGRQLPAMDFLAAESHPPSYGVANDQRPFPPHPMENNIEVSG
ncbi:MAG: DNA repair protein RecO [Nitrospirales bacterium]|nr:DNA repair protein RecO [Nitrospirales bacterium]